MTKEEFLQRGFYRCKPTQFDSEYVTDMFQKKYTDEKGIRYFITVKKYAEVKHPYTGDTIGGGYEYETQLYNKDTHAPVNLQFFSSWNLDDVEKYVEELWNTWLLDYYEMESI